MYVHWVSANVTLPMFHEHDEKSDTQKCSGNQINLYTYRHRRMRK